VIRFEEPQSLPVAQNDPLFPPLRRVIRRIQEVYITDSCEVESDASMDDSKEGCVGERSGRLV
jgi:hypothetical protein